MRARRLARPLGACAVALASVAAASGCGGGVHSASEQTEPLREGLAIELEGITYNIFLTRQLNMQDVEDMAYVQEAGFGGAETGKTYYGVFLEACNVSDEPLRTASSFSIVDSLDEEFLPLALPEQNPFAYQPRTLGPGQCQPADGSVPAGAQTSGVLMIFEVPLESSENRPLELEIHDGFDLAEGAPHELVFELDI